MDDSTKDTPLLTAENTIKRKRKKKSKETDSDYISDKESLIQGYLIIRLKTVRNAAIW